MSKDNLIRHYNEKYFSESNVVSPSIINHTRTPTNRFEACIHYFPNYFQGGDILELGAGSGSIAKSLIAFGLDFNSYTVSEFTAVGVQRLRKSLTDPRMHIIQLDAEMIPDEQIGKYDAVVMIALVEHLVDPLGAMQRIRMLLKPGGLVYIDTPNLAKYTRRIRLLLGQFPSTASTNEGLTTYEGTPVDLYDEGHLHYFTYRSLSLMLTERCNFSRVEKLAYCIPRILGQRIDHTLACLWPELFSELVVIAYA